MSERLLGGLAAEAETIDQNQERRLDQELLLLTAAVALDSSSAVVTMHTTEGRIELLARLEVMAEAADEFGNAGMLMLRHQMKGPDKGKAAFAQLVESAPRPARIVPVIDGQSGDAIVIYRFEDRLPMTVRLTADQIDKGCAALHHERKRKAN